tara:strand:- start:315 stop:884 length:570 start_codon:yes stop_codon:yes gene_type:complete
MPTADKRRIIMGTHVTVKEGSLMEDNTTRKWIMENTINKSLGGKSEITSDDSEMLAAQRDNNWYKGDNKGTEVTILAGTTHQLRNSAEADTLKFLYIKNLNASGGATLTVSLAAEGEWNEGSDANGGQLVWEDSAASAAVRNGGYWNPDYFLKIAPGSSIMLRGDGTTKADAVHVYASAESKIEFIIAK